MDKAKGITVKEENRQGKTVTVVGREKTTEERLAEVESELKALKERVAILENTKP